MISLGVRSRRRRPHSIENHLNLVYIVSEDNCVDGNNTDGADCHETDFVDESGLGLLPANQVVLKSERRSKLLLFFAVVLIRKHTINDNSQRNQSVRTTLASKLARYVANCFR